MGCSLENLDKDLDYNTKSQLLQVFEEVDNLKIEPVEDNYVIRVHIKDSSLYRYAPRRMSIIEKTELKEITDDLLKRSIIKTKHFSILF